MIDDIGEIREKIDIKKNELKKITEEIKLMELEAAQLTNQHSHSDLYIDSIIEITNSEENEILETAENNNESSEEKFEMQKEVNLSVTQVDDDNNALKFKQDEIGAKKELRENIIQELEQLIKKLCELDHDYYKSEENKNEKKTFKFNCFN